MPDTRRVDFADIKSRADFRAILAHYHIALVGQGVNRRRVCTPIGALTPSIATRQVGPFGC